MATLLPLILRLGWIGMVSSLGAAAMVSSLGAAALPMCLPMRSGMPARRFHVAVVYHQVAAAAAVGREGKE